MALYQPGIVFIGMETSGEFRRRFQAQGFETISCDILPSEDGGEEPVYSDDGLPLGHHIVGDVFETLDNLWANDLWPSFAIFHPSCTNLTGAAEWAFKDPDYDRYPGVGYHQRLKPGTLYGAERRAARERDKAQAQRIRALKIWRKVIENPVGALSGVIGRATQIVQPYWFGDDASKKTCLWCFDQDGNPRPDMKLSPTKQAPPRLVDDGRPQLGLFGTGAERWANQTDSGQNRLSPGDERWKDRSRTFPGLADAGASRWGAMLAEYMAS